VTIKQQSSDNQATIKQQSSNNQTTIKQQSSNNQATIKQQSSNNQATIKQQSINNQLINKTTPVIEPFTHGGEWRKYPTYTVTTQEKVLQMQCKWPT
jgi:hypothetical protein